MHRLIALLMLLVFLVAACGATPTHTPAPQPSATAALPTAAPIPPTSTAIPPAATPLPPTATPAPPTATVAAPTATPAPPTATATNSATKTGTPTLAPTMTATRTALPAPALPTAASTPQAQAAPGCPPWLPRIEPGKAILIIENHFIGLRFRIHHFYPVEDWVIEGKATETSAPGRLVIQITPGQHRFSDTSIFASGGTYFGTIMLTAEAGKAYLVPLFYNHNALEAVYPYAIPEGCQ